ncbi:MAG TPA: amidohydrolase family protein [Thermodesulfobacteriota bacterium]|nr:amidohydrolase family protein [Thermodesulfobacteriota bacterium]
MRIDVHTHIVPDGWEDFAARYGGGPWPRLVRHDPCRATIMTGDRPFRDVTDRAFDPVRRIEDMDRLGIDRQVLSPPPVMFCYWAEPKAGQAFARMQNEWIAAAAARHPDRFAGMATVPLQEPGLAIEELRYARERLSLRAVEIGTCPGGRDFDDPALFPFFEACQALDVAVFVHPATPLLGQERLPAKYYFPLIVGNPLETALAISRLIFGGVLERLPRLRIGFAHGGGAFPFTLGRLDHGWRARPEGPAAIPRPPREYARRLFFDSLTHSPANLRFLVQEFGAERVMLGSDYPFDMGDPDPVASVTAASLDGAAHRAILGETAARFLGG